MSRQVKVASTMSATSMHFRQGVRHSPITSRTASHFCTVAFCVFYRFSALLRAQKFKAQFVAMPLHSVVLVFFITFDVRSVVCTSFFAAEMQKLKVQFLVLVAMPLRSLFCELGYSVLIVYFCTAVA